jgi:mono/diheme cytochrome c family protein
MRVKIQGIAAAVLLLAATVAAQQSDSSAGAPARTVWDGAYTSSQAARGQAAYATYCNRCHAADGEGVAQRFTGDRFWAAWGEAPVDRLFTYLRRSMPNDAPGSLSEATYVDVTAFLLQSNGAPAGAGELTAAAAPSIQLTRREGGGLPEGAFVAVSGCLAKDSSGWIVTRAGSPQRPPSGGAPAAATAPPLGTATFRLLYVLSSIDKLEGHTVTVQGLLVRKPADAVNVMDVRSVAPGCDNSGS